MLSNVSTPLRPRPLHGGFPHYVDFPATPAGVVESMRVRYAEADEELAALSAANRAATA